MEKLNWWEVKLPGHYWEIQTDGRKQIFVMDDDGECCYIGQDEGWYFNSQRENVNPEMDKIKYVRIEEPQI